MRKGSYLCENGDSGGGCDGEDREQMVMRMVMIVMMVVVSLELITPCTSIVRKQ